MVAITTGVKLHPPFTKKQFPILQIQSGSSWSIRCIKIKRIKNFSGPLQMLSRTDPDYSLALSWIKLFLGKNYFLSQYINSGLKILTKIYCKGIRVNQFYGKYTRIMIV